MTDASDSDLLAQFAGTASEPAFAALVERHLALVYSVAHRHTADPESARDITQAVFVILARKAGSLGHKVVLSGWLYHTARLTALNWQRSEVRRVRREQEAFMQAQIIPDTAEGPWQELSPQLDAAMATLGAQERDVLVLRYFQNRTMARVAAESGCSENTAQKRVGRALEKLRKFFAKRGVALSSVALAGSVAANSVHAAPVELAAEISALAMAKGVSATTTVSSLISATTKNMFWHKLRLPLATGAAAILVIGTATLWAQRPDKPMASIPYKLLEDAWLFQESINPTNLTFHFVVSCKNEKLDPKNIKLVVQSATRGKIPVQLGSRGTLVNFPVDDDLRRENPLVVSDQPKGSLRTGYWVYVPRPAGLRFRYSQLANAVDEANRAAARASQLAKADSSLIFPIFPGAAVNAVGLNFPAASAGKANVTIATADGPKNYVADAHGLIKLKINPKLQAENPELIFSERPDWIGLGQL